jgi:trans-aconitate methyltransferase
VAGQVFPAVLGWADRGATDFPGGASIGATYLIMALGTAAATRRTGLVTPNFAPPSIPICRKGLQVITSETTTVPWSDLLVSWEIQQTGYLEHREERFAAMLEAIGTLVGEEFTALDIGCGPGSLSQRILERYEYARCIGVDADPVLLSIGQHAQARFGDRLRWADADLRAPDWVDALNVERVDVVMSTTALHWLEPAQLFTLYRQVGSLLREGGLLLNGDNMPFNPSQSACQRLANHVEQQRAHAAFRVAQIPDWERWWALAAAVPELRADFDARVRRQRDAEACYGCSSPAPPSTSPSGASGFPMTVNADGGTLTFDHAPKILVDQYEAVYPVAAAGGNRTGNVVAVTGDANQPLGAVGETLANVPRLATFETVSKEVIIGQKPGFFTYGPPSIANTQLETLGLTNAFSDLTKRGEEVSPEEFVSRNPGFVVLGYDPVTSSPEKSMQEAMAVPGFATMSAVQHHHVLVLSDTYLLGRAVDGLQMIYDAITAAK